MPHRASLSFAERYTAYYITVPQYPNMYLFYRHLHDPVETGHVWVVWGVSGVNRITKWWACPLGGGSRSFSLLDDALSYLFIAPEW